MNLRAYIAIGQSRYINKNSYLSPRLRELKQKKLYRCSGMNNKFLLLYYPQPRSQVFEFQYIKTGLLVNRSGGECDYIYIGALFTILKYTLVYLQLFSQCLIRHLLDQVYTRGDFFRNRDESGTFHGTGFVLPFTNP